MVWGRSSHLLQMGPPARKRAKKTVKKQLSSYGRGKRKPVPAKGHHNRNRAFERDKLLKSWFERKRCSNGGPRGTRNWRHDNYKNNPGGKFVKTKRGTRPHQGEGGLWLGPTNQKSKRPWTPIKKPKVVKKRERGGKRRQVSVTPSQRFRGQRPGRNTGRCPASVECCGLGREVSKPSRKQWGKRGRATKAPRMGGKNKSRGKGEKGCGPLHIATCKDL